MKGEVDMTGGDQVPDDGVRRKVRLALVVFGAIAGFLLLAEHRTHVLPYLPWLLLAACPLIHVFMHHGGHHRKGDHSTATRGADTRAEVRHD